MKKGILEFASSFFYLFLGCVIEILIFNYFHFSNFLLKIVLVALGFALMFYFSYMYFKRRNNIEINPIFTFSLWLRNEITIKQMIITILMQFMGAGVAGLVLHLLFNKYITSLAIGYDELNLANASLDSIILIEFLLSSIFVFCFLITKKKKWSTKFISLFLSIIFFLLLVFSIPYTGGSVNPCRSVVANIYVNSDCLRQIWIYILSSFGGSVFATIIHHIYTQITNKVSLHHFL